MTVFQRITTLLAFLAVSCVIVFSIAISWWLFYPYNVIDIETPIKVLTKQVQQGNICEIEIVYSKYMDILGRRQIQLKNGMMVPLEKEPVYVHLEKGNNIRYRIGFLVPEWYPVGYCHAEITTINEVNPMRTIVEKFTTEEFEVTPNVPCPK